tara:strand:+ start:438 stop:725 length:288 start_codon:yes stop_codon:yes gene_type:complete
MLAKQIEKDNQLASKKIGLEKLNEHYKVVFSSKDGEIVLSHLCKTGFVLDTTHVPGDSHETAHREGMRRIVVSILKFIGKQPSDFKDMLKEAINE